MENSSINQIYDSVVRIEANTIQFGWTAPFVKSNAPTGSGSGFLIDKLGHILTCFHVINQAVHIFVTMSKTGQTRIPAKIIAIYPEMDIAIIKISIKTDTNFLEIGDSDKIKIGKEVMAVGYPLGQDKLKITKGIVSGIQNTYIQVDASINPGNSGGPLLYDGKVIGINTAKIVDVGTEGIGFANPINIFSKLKNRMFSNKNTVLSSEDASVVSYIKNDIVRIESSSLGILVDSSTKQIMDFYQTECNSGIQITKIFDNSPLKSGEFPAKDGDILCSIGYTDDSKGYSPKADKMFIIDNNGECVVPWNREKVNYSDVFDRLCLTESKIKITYFTILKNKQSGGGFIIKTLSDLLESVTGTFNKPNVYETEGKLITVEVPMVPVKKIFKIWNYFPPYDDVKYVAFGGLVMMNLTMNHIMMKKFQHLFYNYVNKLDHSVVIITKILPSSIKIDDILNEGDVISEINGVPIENIDDVSESLKHPIYKINKDNVKKCYFTIKTGLNKFYCIGLNKVIKEDIQLFQYLNYTPSEATKYFIKFMDSDPCLKLSKEDSNSTNLVDIE
jgi:S1-C subfamily serine protease